MPTIISSFKGETKRHALNPYDEAEFQYPCSDPVVCSPITISVPPGTYKLEVYGASVRISSLATTLRINSAQCDISQQTVEKFRGIIHLKRELHLHETKK